MASLAFKVIGTIGLASYAIAYLCAKRRHIAYHRFKLVAVPAISRSSEVAEASGVRHVACNRCGLRPRIRRASHSGGGLSSTDHVIAA